MSDPSPAAPARPSPDRPPRAVVFDFDGVILESAAIKTAAFLEVFSDHPEIHDRILEHHLENLGVSRFEKFAWIHEHLLGRPLTPAGARRLGERYAEVALAKILECPLVAGALELLRDLGGRCLRFVASGTPQQELESIVQRRGLEGLFEEVHGTPATKPAILADLLARYALSPGEVVLVGDGISDYRAAAAVGIAFVARVDPTEPKQFAGLAVDRVTSLEDLRPLIGLPPGAGARAADRREGAE